MTPGQHNFTIRQNTTFLETVEWRGTDGVTIDLRDYTARMEIRPAPGATILIFLATADDRIVHRDDKKIDLVLTDDETRPLTTGTYVYDLLVANIASGEVTPLLAGKVVVAPSVTLGDVSP